MRPPLTIALLLVVTGAPSRAVPADPPVLPGALLRLECETLRATAGALGAAVPCCFDGDGRLDVLGLVGEDLFLTSGPDPRQYGVSLGLDGVTSFTVVPMDSGRRQGALASVPGGLLYVVRDDTVGGALFRQVPVAGPAWASARAMVAVDLDGDGDLDVAGLDATGTSLLTLERRGPALWQERPAVALGVEVDGLHALRWTSQRPEFATVVRDPAGQDDSILVVDAQGVLVSLRTPGGTVDDLDVLVHGAGLDRLAVLSGTRVTVLRAGGVQEPPVDLLDCAPSAMVATDMDGDGMGDLAVNSTVVDRVTVLRGSAASSATLSAVDAWLVPLDEQGADLSVQRAAPLVGDFDGDGDLDLLQFFDDTRTAVLARRAVVDETALQPGVTVLAWTLQGGTTEAVLELVVPSMPDGSAPDHLEVTVASTVGEPGGRGIESVLYHGVHGMDGFAPGATVIVPIAFDVEVGHRTSLFVRALADAPGGTHVDRVGPESVRRFERSSRSGGGSRGTSNGIDPIPGGQGGTEGWPPPPPKPIVI